MRTHSCDSSEVSPKLVAAPDKFKGTATASQVAEAIKTATEAAGWICDKAPIADGGDGTLDIFGGQRRVSRVTGPLGELVEAEWLMRDKTAVVETAQASGLMLAGGAEGNDPIAATSAGVGELVVAAAKAGADRILIGLGGVASTDGGLGALEAMQPLSRLASVEMNALVDTFVPFLDAARVYSVQKGATPSQMELLERRLVALADRYARDHGVDVLATPGAGAAGGLGGAFAAAGASIVSGFWQLADEIGLEERIAGADLVVTGEGRLDQQSFTGKVVTGVLELAQGLGVPVLVVAGSADREALGHPALEDTEVLVLAEEFGAEASMADPVGCIEGVLRSRFAL